MRWIIRFRVISPSDYHTPFMHIPIESTLIEAESAEEAWEKWITAPYAFPRDWYRKEEIFAEEVEEG